MCILNLSVLTHSFYKNDLKAENVRLGLSFYKTFLVKTLFELVEHVSR